MKSINSEQEFYICTCEDSVLVKRISEANVVEQDEQYHNSTNFCDKS